jgi:bis(5'-nucleosidyl)-tetraphosphatase
MRHEESRTMADLNAAGVICYIQDGKDYLYLLLRSSKHGEWGPPKGHADKGESDIETAARELFEETGLRNIRYVPGYREVLKYTVNKKDKKLSKEVVFFLGEMDGEVQLSEEHTEAHMATLDEIEVMVPHEDLRQLYRTAEAHLKKTPRSRD